MEHKLDSSINSKYQKARKRVEDLKGFYYHLITYCLVIPFIIFINYKTYWDFQWFWFPLAGWGVGLSIHAYHIFVNNGIFGKKWEERKLQEFINQEEKERWT